ncbi:MAG: S8 family serine peptidase [Lysobacter sp.]
MHLPCRLLLTLVLLATAMPAPAQRLGGLPAASQYLPPAVERLPAAAIDRAQRLDPRVTDGALSRQAAIAIRLRRHAAVLDIDAAGAPVVRGEVIVINPTADTLAQATAAGFSIAGEHQLVTLGLRAVVLRARPGMDTREALATLRRLVPAGEYDYNHLYLDAGQHMAATAAVTTATASAPAAVGFKVGLIDSGVSDQHPALAGVRVRHWGCDGHPVPDAHGTAVASLLAGSLGGTTPAGTTLYSADIYCRQPTGGAVTGFVAAMEWMARERVPVINLSMVGPSNTLLQKAIEAMAARGHLLAAAVGNDGPAAPPLYPAAYPQVIGVTAVNQRDRALTEAGRGAHVELAAPGEHTRVALPDGKWGPMRGTSFAAPLVARIAAARLAAPDVGAASRVRAQLAAEAIDLGRRGRDDTYGHGLLGPHHAVVAQAASLNEK